MYETNYSVNDNIIRLGVPISKVDAERRMVHGFATLDNLDKQGDVVLFEASVEAFEKFRGNIREQHDPKKAVGKMVSFKPDSLYDPETGKMYQGVFVSAYVSKGAQDTWEKVLDGTLSGFSIGGVIKSSRKVFDEVAQKMVRIVDGYEMDELSLVDGPANQLSNFALIQKNDRGEFEQSLIKGDLETIYMCVLDRIISVTKETDSNCPICGDMMKDVGFVESKDPEKAGIIKGIVTNILGADQEKEANSSMTEAEQPEVEEVAAVEGADEAEVVEKAEGTEAEEVVEKADESDEANEEVSGEAETEQVEKAESQENTAESLLVKSLESIVDTLAKLTERVETLQKSVDSKVEEVKKTVKSNSDAIEKFGERVTQVEDKSAIRKSGDLGEVAQEKVEQRPNSVWGGTFLTNVSDL